MRILTLNEQGLVAGGRMMQPDLMPPVTGGSGGGYGGYEGSYGGGGGGYLPPIDIQLAPIDIGGFDTTLDLSDVGVGPIHVDVKINTDDVNYPIMSAETAAAVGNAATALCTSASKRWTGAVGCSFLGSGLAHILETTTASHNYWERLGQGLANGSKWGMLP
ncbi:hypothetical protein [Dyella agri]|uniref:Uncharacterized protein n=1 Tax=Dyella agri TaxID=1926869 RepID=A0ABW8KMN5_9GAMM